MSTQNNLIAKFPKVLIVYTK